MGRIAQAHRVDAVLRGVLAKASERHRELSDIQRRWSRLVGGSLAAHSRPVSLRRKRLVVHVAAPGDSFILSFHREKVLKRLRAATKGNVEDLVIRPGDL